MWATKASDKPAGVRPLGRASSYSPNVLHQFAHETEAAALGAGQSEVGIRPGYVMVSSSPLLRAADALQLVSYTDTPVGSYDELIYAPCRFLTSKGEWVRQFPE
jgi:hypothetical protein